MVSDQYSVHRIAHHHTKEWIYKKHYAKRRCAISYAFGLFNSEDVMVGVCTFGSPPNYRFNDGACIFKDYKVKTLELNRLVTNDELPRNTLSYFVSQCLKQLPQPTCIVSYSDPNEGHYGYIYQATNWIYTGESSPKYRYWFSDGSCFDIRRGIDKKVMEHGTIIKRKRLIPTQRYVYFNGNKMDKKIMRRSFKMKDLPYPKGNNKPYDASYQCETITLDDIQTNGDDKMKQTVKVQVDIKNGLVDRVEIPLTREDIIKIAMKKIESDNLNVDWSTARVLLEKIEEL